MIDTSGVDLFLDDLRRDCIIHQVTLKFHKGRTVPLAEGIRGSGYFSGSDKILAVAKGREDWLWILVHESCHLDQWIENCKVWADDDRWPSGDLIDSHIVGDKVDRRRLRRAILRTIKLELDCERRSLVKIAEYNLPINTATYIQRANAYVLSYHRVYTVGKWVPGIYDKTVLTSRLPEKMMPDEYYMKERFSKYFELAGL
jgi:hypothetical protein